jgi:UDP-N-acetylmuramate dehydrogenase
VVKKLYSINMHALPNTFGIAVQAERFVEISSQTQLLSLLPFAEPVRILGEGSNILFTRPVVKELVLLNRIKGIELLQTDETFVWVQAGAGENWAAFVDYTVAQGWGGLENLSLIYGTVGAAPIQNIGAYGVEVGTLIQTVEAVHLQTGKVQVFSADACGFGYRESIFKKDFKDTYCITQVSFKLHKQPKKFQLQYGEVEAMLRNMQADFGNLNPALVAEAVKKIRTQKLPNPAELGNAGSFFKNPIVSNRQYRELQQEFPAIPSYPYSETQVKIPAAWLIQQLGWKGKRQGDAGVSPTHALVLVNHGKASGAELKELAWDIMDSVQQKFRLMLMPEVNMW